MGLPATTNPGGAGKWWDGHANYLAGKDVIIFPDNDESGRRHGLQMATSLIGKAKNIKVVDLPGLPAKGDLVDWANVGGTAEQLAALMDAAPCWTPEAAEAAEDENLFTKSTDLYKDPPPEPIIKNLLYKGGLGVLIAAYGKGKTFFSLDMGIHVALGKPWWGHKTEAAPLVYVNLEGRMVNRLSAWEQVNGPAPEFFVFESKQFNINDEKFLNTFIRSTPQGALVIIDTLAIVAGGLNLDRVEEVTILYNKFRKIAGEIGGAVIVVAHLGKDQKRGAAGHIKLKPRPTWLQPSPILAR